MSSKIQWKTPGIHRDRALPKIFSISKALKYSWLAAEYILRRPSKSSPEALKMRVDPIKVITAFTALVAWVIWVNTWKNGKE
jgi:hypothetical protein